MIMLQKTVKVPTKVCSATYRLQVRRVFSECFLWVFSSVLCDSSAVQCTVQVAAQYTGAGDCEPLHASTVGVQHNCNKNYVDSYFLIFYIFPS